MPEWDTGGNSVGGAAFLGTTNAQPLRIRTNNAQQMVLTTSGNLGIGTTTASQKLTLGVGNVLLPTADRGNDGNLYFGGITDAGQTGMRLFGGLVNGAIPAGFIDVRTTDANDG